LAFQLDFQSFEETLNICLSERNSLVEGERKGESLRERKREKLIGSEKNNPHRKDISSCFSGENLDV
jgi:hypothetical protein